MDCGVTVLTTGFWPTYKVDEVALPNELVKCVDKFTQFYESRTSHRKLKWIHTLGTCVVVGRFDAKPIDLVISTYQACILMLFNQQQEYTTADVASATKLPMEELKKYLQTLALSKCVCLSCLCRVGRVPLCVARFANSLANCLQTHSQNYFERGQIPSADQDSKEQGDS
jgi:hypothetical protein